MRFAGNEMTEKDMMKQSQKKMTTALLMQQVLSTASQVQMTSQVFNAEHNSVAASLRVGQRARFFTSLASLNLGELAGLPHRFRHAQSGDNADDAANMNVIMVITNIAAHLEVTSLLPL